VQIQKLHIHSLALFFTLILGMAAPSVEAWAVAVVGNPNAPKTGSISLNLGSEPTTLNPLNSTDLYASRIQGFILESLAGRNEDTYEWEPALAKSWEIAKDGKTFTFKLRQGVLWQDGQPLTAEDVKFSFDVIFDPKYQTAHLRPYYEGIEKVEILDPETVRFTTKEKYFRNFEVSAGLTVIPKHVYADSEKGTKINRELIGTGPYFIEKYEKGKRIILKLNSKWWGTSEPYNKGQYNFDQMIFRFVKEDNVALEMLKKGELDYEGFSPETYIERTKGPEWGTKVIKVKTQNSAPKGYGFIAWNLRRPLFKDRKVRLALYHLINRKLMNEKFRYGMSTLATGPFYRLSEYASPKVKEVEFDPKKALKLLREAGFEDTDKDGILDKVIDGEKTPFKFTLFSANQETMKYLTLFKEDAKQVGVEIDVKFVEWNSFVKLMDEAKFDALTLAWAGGPVDPDPKQIWYSTGAVPGGSNFIAYNNPEVDKLIDEGRAIMDRKGRIPVFQKVFEKIAEDVPYAFLFNDKNTLYGHTSRIKKTKDTLKYSVGTNFWWVEK
jgi:peptide/nickel transport system substrate-binding protein/microcin C transport system substrate-binding protein